MALGLDGPYPRPTAVLRPDRCTGLNMPVTAFLRGAVLRGLVPRASPRESS